MRLFCFALPVFFAASAAAETADTTPVETSTESEEIESESVDSEVGGGLVPSVAFTTTDVDGRAYLRATLENGLEVSILADDDHPVVATQVWMSVGSSHETASEQGFAHLFEHMMFGVTENYGKEDYNRHHIVHGGSENAYTSFDNTVYISEIPPAGHEQVLVFEADRMSNLVLSQENLDNEKKIVTEELRLRGENNPISRLLSPALAAMFGEHPYGHSPAGTKTDIANADLELTRKFYEGYYRPGNAHLVIVGPVDAEATLAHVERLWAGDAGDRLVPPEIPSLADWDFPKQINLQEDIPPIKLAALVHTAPAAGHADYWAYKLLLAMLSGGNVDRLRESLVTERGKAIEALTDTLDLKAGSLWIAASISLPTRRRAKAFKLLRETIEILDGGDWRSAGNLETARRSLLRDELEKRYFAAQEADAIGQALSWQGDDTLGLGGSVSALEAVKLEDVERVWKTYIAEAEPVEFFVKKGKVMETQQEVMDAPETPAASSQEVAQ